MESEKQVLNDALDQLITEAGHMLQDFKQHIAFENENTLKKSDSDAKHLKAYTSLLAQWSQIKNLYMLILSTQDKESVEKIAPIEVILQKISSPEVKFKNHEFQFPFNVTTLISFVKGIVKASQRPEKKSTKKLSEDTIDTNNVREAAKKFQELTERVAETVTLSKKKTVKSFDQKVKNRNLLKAPLKMRSATVRVPSSRTTGDIDKSSLEQPKSPVDETMAYLYGNETESPKTIVIEETKFDRLGRPRPPVPVKPQFEELAAKLKNTSLSRSATMKGADRAASGSKDIESHSRASSGAVRADSAPPDFENSASKEVSSALADKTLSRTASGQIPTNSDLKASDNLVKPTLNHASSIARLHPDISSSQDNINSAFGLVKSASSGIMKKMETIQNHGHSPSSPPRELKSGKGASSLSVSNLANIYQTASPTLNKNELGRSGSMKIKSSVRDQIAAIQNHGSKDIGSLANLKVSAELSRNNEVSPKKSQNDGSEVANKELEVEKKEIINAPINLVAAEENIEVHSAPAPETPLVARLEVDPVSRPLSIQGERKTSIKVNPHSDSEPVRKLSAKPDDAPKENDTEPVKPQVETAKDANEEITTDQDKFLSATSLELCQSRKASIKIDGRLSGNEPRKMSLKECMPPTLSRKASIKPSVEDIQEAVKAVEFKVASEIIEITKEIETGDQNFVAEGTIPGSPSRKMSSCSTSTIDPKQAGNTKSLSTSGNDLTIERNSADTANTNGDAFYFARTMVPGDETANLLRDGNLNGSNTNPAIVIDDAESPERLFVPTRTPVMEDEVDNPFRSSRKNRKSFEVEPSLPAKTKVIVKRTPIDENEKENPLRGKLSFRKENKDDSETEIVEEKRASKSFAEDRVAPATQSEIGQSLPLNLISTAPVPEVSQDVDQIELSAALNGMAVPMKYGMGNSEFSAATVVKAKRETINDMTEDQIAELEIEMESSQPSEADADEFLATTTSNRRISLPMTSVFETTENDPLLSLQTNSMFGSFHGESKLDLDAESIGGEDAEEDSILANEDDFPLDSSPKLEDDTVAATDANEGAAKMKAHRVVGLQKLKNTKSDLASKQQESPMNALYAAVYTANSTKAPPPPVVNRSAKPRSSSKSTPNAYEQPLRVLNFLNLE